MTEFGKIGRTWYAVLLTHITAFILLWLHLINEQTWSTVIIASLGVGSAKSSVQVWKRAREPTGKQEKTPQAHDLGG